MQIKANVNPDGNVVMRRAQRRKDSTRTPILQLERVLGFTANRNTGLSLHPSKDLLVYPAGCTAVVLDWKQKKQGPFLLATSNAESADVIQNGGSSSSLAAAPIAPGPKRLPKPGRASSIDKGFSPPKAVVSTAFSPCGRYMAVGEAGRQPRVLIWDLETEKYIVQLKGHKFGVLALAFSPDLKHLVSLGYQHDGVLNVWNWRNATRVASNRISSKVNALSFSSDGSFCVTVGLRHVRFWYFNHSQNKDPNPKTRVLEGRSGVLGDYKTSHFLDVACSDKDRSVYAITAEGQLCMFSEGRKIEKWIDLKTKGAISLSFKMGKLVCGCSDGVTRLFSATPLKHLCTLPKPHYLGMDVSKFAMNTYQVPSDSQEQFPDTIASRFSADGTQVINMFSDRSLYIWDIKDINNIQKTYSAIYHSDSIWDSEFLPTADGSQLATCSSDGTIKIWNLEEDSFQNIHSEDLVKILHIEEDGILRYQRPAILPTETLADQPGAPRTNTDSTQGVRCLKFTPDGKYMVSGDRRGNLRVHDSSTFELVTYQEAHDSEIMDIDVLTLQSDDATSYSIASASRDRLIHVFSLSPGTFRLLQTLDDHSSSITSLCFFDHGSRLISCGADKSVIFRNSIERVGLPYYTSYHNHCGRATFYAMASDHSNNTITAVALDKRIHQFCTLSGKLLNSIKLEEPGVDVSMTRVTLDSSGQFACVAGTDKGIRIIDLATGQLIGAGHGHSEMVTSVRFSPDCSRIITTSGDGCIYIWRVLPSLALQMRSRLYKLTRPLPVLNSRRSENRLASGVTNPTTSGIPSRNPLTKAANRITDPQFDMTRPRASSIDVGRFASFSKSKGRWAQKIGTSSIAVLGSSLPTQSNGKPVTVESSSPIKSDSSGSSSPTKSDSDSLDTDSSISPSPEKSNPPVVSLSDWSYPEEVNTDSIPDIKNSSSPSPTLSEKSSYSMEINDDFSLGDDISSDAEEAKLEKVFEDYLHQPIQTEFSKHRRSLSSKFKAFHVIRKLPRNRKAIPDAFPESPLSSSPPSASPNLPPIRRTKELSGPFSTMRKSRSSLLLKQPSSPLKQELPASPKTNDNCVGVRPVLSVSMTRPLSSTVDFMTTYSDHSNNVLGPAPLSLSLSSPGFMENKLGSLQPMLIASMENENLKSHPEAYSSNLHESPTTEMPHSFDSNHSTGSPLTQRSDIQALELAKMKQTLQITHKLIDDLCESYKMLNLGDSSSITSGPRSNLKFEFDSLFSKLSNIMSPTAPVSSNTTIPSGESNDYAQLLVEKYSDILVQAVVDKLDKLSDKDKP